MAVIEQAAPPAAPAERTSVKRSRPPIGLFGIPIFVAILLAVWLVWRLNAAIDSTEMVTMNWSALGTAVWQHLQLTAVGTVLVMIIAVPLGIALTRPGLRRFSGPVLAFANGGQAAPSIGLLVLAAMWLGFGFWTAILALGVYAILPVLRNTIVGLDGVDRTLVEAGRGMGMSAFTALARIEIPLAVPVILAGIRTALVLMVGTASLAVFINAGGLGIYITTGVSLFRNGVLLTGAVMISSMALLIDWVGRLLEYAVRPKGIR
ncbi:ABC transporter permease [Microlunatus endophyticus]|uniref:ABC transporter permease n=1 Tax=Microlunatus endophyticus TaxID=1716077 RepID=A0A917SDV0_9ACTN|nr:ABC transporter permease [Microlunatus endophyticus]GGL70709.1 ABC transporter permease [Microlunatus endophyticus]